MSTVQELCNSLENLLNSPHTRLAKSILLEVPQEDMDTALLTLLKAKKNVKSEK